jgi:hypothetical protein
MIALWLANAFSVTSDLEIFEHFLCDNLLNFYKNINLENIIHAYIFSALRIVSVPID